MMVHLLDYIAVDYSMAVQNGQIISQAEFQEMNEFAAKLEFEDAARLRDEINRLKAKEVGLSDKILKFKKNKWI